MSRPTYEDETQSETAEFPIVCETCLGPNPYVRMQKIPNGGTCNISGRPYTQFRWRPGAEARYKKTVVCQEVAKAKNVCQVCLLDLQYGLPVQVRDKALALQEEMLPQSVAGKEFALKQMEENGELDNEAKFKVQPNEILQRLARSTPYYKRNEAKICSFFVKGNCNRGAACPYRHEMPQVNELSNQSMRARYYGVNDPVANKMLSKTTGEGGGGGAGSMEPPSDVNITTLFVGGVPPDASDKDVRDVFYSYGEIEYIKVMPQRSCAFVTFATRQGAERAASGLGSKIQVKGIRCSLRWGKPSAQREEAQAEAGTSGRRGGFPPPQPMGGYPPTAAIMMGGGAAYPSMDPTQYGAVQRPRGDDKDPGAKR